MTEARRLMLAQVLIMVGRDQLNEEFPEENCRSGGSYREPDWDRVEELQRCGDEIAADAFRGLSEDEQRRLWQEAQKALAKLPEWA